MTPEDILKDQQRARQAQQDLDRLIGAREREMQQMQQQFQVMTLEEAEQLMLRLEQELVDVEKRYQKAIAIFYKLMDSKLEES